MGKDLKANEQAAVICEPPASSADEARRRGIQLIYSNWPQMVAVFVDAACHGSVPHAKLLCDIWSASAPKEKGKAESHEAAPKKEEDDSASQLLQLLIDTITKLQAGEFDEAQAN